MAKDFNNRLITPELEKAMQDYPLYSQDSKKKDAVCIAVFFIGNARWYILEGQRENDDFVLFGIVVGLAETEYSYISANEMASVELDATQFGLGIVRVEQRKPFQPCQLSEIFERAKRLKEKNNIEVDANFFKNKIVCIWDDVVTTGTSFCAYTAQLEQVGAHVTNGIFLGKTSYKYVQQ